MSDIQAHGPAFFKYFPPSFVAKYKNILPQKATLETDQPGKLWPVKMEQMHDDLRITDGWKPFAEENILVFSDFLMFHFVNRSRIKVTIFEPNGCKRMHVITKPDYRTSRALPAMVEKITKASPTCDEESEMVFNDSSFTFTMKEYTRGTTRHD